MTDEMRQAAATRAPAPAPRGFWARNALVLLLAGVVVIAGAVTAVSIVTKEAALTEQQAQIEVLEQELQQAEQADSAQVEQSVTDVLGINESRVAEDTATLEALVETAFTWSSADTYEDARETLERRFGLALDDQILSELIPPATFNETLEGDRAYFIDAEGLTSSVRDSEATVMQVQAGDYAYLVLVTLEASSAVGDAEGTEGLRSTVTRELMLQVTIDATGAIVSATGVPASSAVRTAG